MGKIDVDEANHTVTVITSAPFTYYYGMKVNWTLNYTVTIQAKDGRARTSYTNLSLSDRIHDQVFGGRSNYQLAKLWKPKDKHYADNKELLQAKLVELYGLLNQSLKADTTW